MLPVILICAFMVKNAATQPVNATLGTTNSCVLIGDEVKLLCTVSSGCCTSSARVWEKGSGSSILNDGISTDSSKYVEDYDNGTTGFNLIIKNVQKSDFGINYKCRYGVISSDELYLDNILCPSSEVNISGPSSELNISGNCWKCAGQDYGWSILGTVIGTVFMIVVKYYIMIVLMVTQIEVIEPKTVFIVGGLIFILSAVVNIPIAVPIGKYVCHCVDGTDPLLILLGLVTSVAIGLIIIKIKLKQGSSQGSNGSNEQPLKENKKKKPAAEKSSNEPPLEKKKKKKSAAETGSNEPPLEKKKKKKSAAETGSRSPTAAAKHIKTANNETEMIPTEKGFSGDLEKKRPLPPLTTQLSPTNRPIPLPSSTKPLPSSTRPLPQITTNKGDN